MTDTFFSNLSTALKDLPGEKAHVKMAPLSRPISSEALKLVSNFRESAVALVLFNSTSEISFALIQRTSYNGAHSKQISFPGGKMENTDENLIKTALRETEEEIGLLAENMEYLGELTPIYIPVSNFKVEPFVFKYNSIPKFRKQEREVEEIISVGLSLLEDEKNVSKMKIDLPNFKKTVPCFNFNKQLVWGATAIILNEFKEVLKRTKNI